MMKRSMAAALLVAFALWGALAGAQSLTGTVAGRVTDEQGGVLPGVTVTLTGKTGSQTQVTDAKGEFRFLGLNPGLYNIKAELQGFRSKEQVGLDVGLSKTIEVNLPMAVGGVSETIDVVANAVTIDTTTTATDTSLSQDLLFSMPISHNNPAVSILQYMPGVTDGSAFGGASDGANSLMLDGVDTRDPEGGTAWTFYNYNIIDEVQVGGLGQTAEYGGFTGAVVNTITKSGGNRFSSLSEFRYTNNNGFFSSSNTKSSYIEQNPALANTVQILSMKDYTVQLGGPIKKDKLFFFGSVQRYSIEQYNPPVRTEISPRFNLKLTYQPTANDNIIGSIQYDQYNQTGRTGLIPGWAVSNHNQTIDQDSPEIIYNAQYRRVFNSSTFFEAKFTGWWGYYDLNPVSSAPTHYDYDGTYSGGAGYTAQYDRTRTQLNASLSKYAQMAGTHNFKFGMEIERSTIRDRLQYSGGLFYYDYYGAPYSAYGYSYDLRGKNKRESFYAQDQWKLANRLTLNVGLRVDHIVGEAETTGQTLYKTWSWGPRLGFAYDLSGKGTSVVRGYFGKLYDGSVFSSWSRAVPGLTPTDYYYYDSEAGQLVFDHSVARTYTVNTDNIKHPEVTEWNASWEQQFMKQFKLTVTGIARDWHNFVNSTLVGGQWTSQTATLPEWDGPGSNPLGSVATVPYYRWANPVSVPSFLIQNTDTVTYDIDGKQVVGQGKRRYRGLMFVLERPMKNRWQAQFSWVISKTEGTISNSTYAGISSAQFETPNGILVNSDGPTAYDRRHMVRLFAGYQIPKIEVAVNGYWRYESGWPYAPYYRLSQRSTTHWTGAINQNIVPRGSDSFMLPSFTQTDLRIEKVVNYKIHRFGVYLDLLNAFNQNSVQGVVTRYPYSGITDPFSGDTQPVYLGMPSAQQTARQITLGVRWSF
jgi:outer membrane receptor protein involved in Fe transport